MHATQKMKDTIFVENFKAFNFCSDIFALKLIFSEIFVENCQEGPCYCHKWWSSRVGEGRTYGVHQKVVIEHHAKFQLCPIFFQANGNFGANFPGLFLIIAEYNSNLFTNYTSNLTRCLDPCFRHTAILTNFDVLVDLSQS